MKPETHKPICFYKRHEEIRLGSITFLHRIKRRHKPSGSFLNFNYSSSSQMAPPEPVITSAVILYLATDILSLRQAYMLPVLVNISLIQEDNQTSIVHSGVINITCTTTGFVLPVVQDLTVPVSTTNG